MPAWPTSALGGNAPRAPRPADQPASMPAAEAALKSGLPAWPAPQHAGTATPEPGPPAWPAPTQAGTAAPEPGLPAWPASALASNAPSARRSTTYPSANSFGAMASHQAGAPPRVPGTVYGPGAAQPDSPGRFQPANHLENSGSLTGHILAQGSSDRPIPSSRSAKVVTVMIIVLVVLVAVGLLGATVARDAITGLLHNLIGNG